MEIAWQQTQSLVPLSERTVHVWCADLKVTPQKFRYLWSLLIEDEKNQANKFISVVAKESFIISRSILRFLLSKYLKITPKKLIFELGKCGKPYVQLNGTHKLPLQFNISHSGDLALFAFTLHNEVGVDIEYIRPKFNYEEIAPQFFSKQENIVLSSLPKDHRLEAFFTCWTRKEAFIKTIGEGLSFPLDKFDVDLITKSGTFVLYSLLIIIGPIALQTNQSTGFD